MLNTALARSLVPFTPASLLSSAISPQVPPGMATGHIVVLHIVECRASDARFIAEQASSLQLTVRLFYRKEYTALIWRDVIIVAEGECSEVDEFIAALKSRCGDCRHQMRGVSLLLRQWSYTMSELPSERASWGYEQWMQEAEREQQQQQAEEGPSRAAANALPECEGLHRHLGPAGVKGAAYTDMGELIAKRLHRLDLGCSWDDVLLAAKLSTAMATRSEPVTVPEEPVPGDMKKRSRPSQSMAGSSHICGSTDAASGSSDAAIMAASGRVMDLQISEG